MNKKHTKFISVVAIVLMLAAMIMYVLSDDESLVPVATPNENVEQPADVE